MPFIALITENGWRPGVGDPDFLGWATAITYFLVAGLCAWAWRGERSLGWRAGRTARPLAWVAMGMLLVLLGINNIRAGSSIPGFDLINGSHLQAMHLLLEFSSLIMIGAGAARALGHVSERARAQRQNALAMDGGGLRLGEAIQPLPQINRTAPRRAA